MDDMLLKLTNRAIQSKEKSSVESAKEYPFVAMPWSHQPKSCSNLESRMNYSNSKVPNSNLMWVESHYFNCCKNGYTQKGNTW
jgi:hypothetical protein